MFFWVGALSISLAIVNLLPIPALDGGRVLFIGIEVLRRGKRISPEREGLVNLIGMGMLLFLMLVVTINDVGNLLHP
jgi:regulator of sigma E protease